MKGLYDYYKDIIHEFKKYEDEEVVNMLKLQIGEGTKQFNKNDNINE